MPSKPAACPRPKTDNRFSRRNSARGSNALPRSAAHRRAGTARRRRRIGMRSASLIFYRFSTNGDHHDTAIEQCDRRNRIGDFGCRDGSGPATSAADNVDNDPTDAGRITTTTNRTTTAVPRGTAATPAQTQTTTTQSTTTTPTDSVTGQPTGPSKNSTTTATTTTNAAAAKAATAADVKAGASASPQNWAALSGS